MGYPCLVGGTGGLPAPPNLPRLKGRNRVLAPSRRVVTYTKSGSTAKCARQRPRARSGSRESRSFRYLPDRVLNVLPGERILEFRREERDPVQAQDQIEALLRPRAVPKLTDDREQVRRVEPARLLVEPARRAEVRQLELAPRILDALTEHIEGTAPLKLLREALEEPCPNLRAMVLLQARPGARLRSNEEIDDIRRKEAEVPVVVDLGVTPQVATGREAIAVRGRWDLLDRVAALGTCVQAPSEGSTHSITSSRTRSDTFAGVTTSAWVDQGP